MRQEEDLLVGELDGDLVHRGVSERNASVFGLEAVDQVAEDPASAAGALAVATLLAEPAAPTRGHARHQDVIAALEVGDAGPDFVNGATAS